MPEWATKTHLFQPLGFASVPPFHSCSNHFYTESKQWETSLFQNLKHPISEYENLVFILHWSKYLSLTTSLLVKVIELHSPLQDKVIPCRNFFVHLPLKSFKSYQNNFTWTSSSFHISTFLPKHLVNEFNLLLHKARNPIWHTAFDYSYPAHWTVQLQYIQPLAQVASNASLIMYPCTQSCIYLYTVYMQLSNNMHYIYRFYTISLCTSANCDYRN